MKAQIIRIGNSQGVRLPKPILEQAGLKEEVEIKAAKGKITLSKPEQPRTGWAEAAAKMASPHDDQQLVDYTPTKFDEEEWQW